jgi:DNA-directed RNA polymerase specialized sigma24 family protein
MTSSADESADSVAESLGSVTMMYQRAVDGDSQAADALWHAYARRLSGLAGAVLRQRGIAPAQTSQDSVVNVAFARFFEALARGKYHDVADRHELWRLLAVITRNTALNQAKRARNRAIHEAHLASSGMEFADAGPTPEEIAALCDTIAVTEQRIRERSTSSAQSDRIVRVLNMTLSGHTQREIADAIGQSEVTVRRNLQMIRDLLRSEP